MSYAREECYAEMWPVKKWSKIIPWAYGAGFTTIASFTFLLRWFSHWRFLYMIWPITALPKRYKRNKKWAYPNLLLVRYNGTSRLILFAHIQKTMTEVHLLPRSLPVCIFLHWCKLKEMPSNITLIKIPMDEEIANL